MKATRDDLIVWTDKAREHILALPVGPARAAFEKLCDFVVERTG